MIIATAGHIDHGKTALIKALTGVDTTHLPEEHRRGMTIDLGFASMPIADDRSISFVDVPGHERFIRTMLAGVSGIDMALLVVAADDGPMPQTREHLQILDLLKIPRCAVVISKTDCASPKRIAEVEQSVMDLLESTSLRQAPIFHIAAIDGAGVDLLRDYLVAQSAIPVRVRQGSYFRMPIDRSFLKAGAGLVITGTVATGSVASGDHLEILPTKHPVRIRAVQTHQHAVEHCGPGERCALNIIGPGVDRALVSRGDWIVAPEIAIETTHFEVRCEVSPDADLRDNMGIHFCHGTRRTLGRLVPLTAVDDRNMIFAHVISAEPVHVLARDRFILRNGSDTLTVAGGVVLNPFAPARGYRRPERAGLVAAYDKPDARTALPEILQLSRDGLDLGLFAQAWNLRADEAAALWKEFDVVQVGKFGIDRRHWEAMKVAFLDKVAQAERESPGGNGPTALNLIGAKRGSRLSGIPSAALDALVRENRLAREGAYYRLPKENLSASDQKLWLSILPFLERHPPATIHSIGSELNIRPEEAERVLRRAMQVDLVRRIHSGRFFTKAAFFALSGLAETLSRESADGTFTTASFRDRSGLGRNLTIELLEHFDRIKLTHRVGDNSRTVIKPTNAVAAEKA